MEDHRMPPDPFAGSPFAGMDLSEMLRQIPELGKFEFEGVQYEIGRMVSPENPEQTIGIVFQWYFPPLPWFKFRIPFERLAARKLCATILAELGDDEESA